MNVLDILTFDLEGQRYGLLSSTVAAVCRMVSLTALPKAPEIVKGVIDFRGVLVPVLNMRARFGLPARPAAHTDYLIVAHAGSRLAAVHVEQVPELVSIQAQDLEDIEKVVSGTAHLAGVARLADGLVLVHDLGSFLTQAESEELTEAVAGYVA
jgi:purine-binding chemotaxis protein CheW